MLEKITDLTCPDCNAKMTSERREQKHCNGYWNEYRSFDCGKILYFSPNFMSIKEYAKCANTKEAKKERHDLKVAKEKISKYLIEIKAPSILTDKITEIMKYTNI